MPEKQRRSQDTSRAAWAGDIGAGPCHVKCEIAEKFTFFVKRFCVFSVLMTNAAAASVGVNSAVRLGAFHGSEMPGYCGRLRDSGRGLAAGTPKRKRVHELLRHKRPPDSPDITYAVAIYSFSA